MAPAASRTTAAVSTICIELAPSSEMPRCTPVQIVERRPGFTRADAAVEHLEHSLHQRFVDRFLDELEHSIEVGIFDDAIASQGVFEVGRGCFESQLVEEPRCPLLQRQAAVKTETRLAIDRMSNDDPSGAPLDSDPTRRIDVEGFDDGFAVKPQIGLDVPTPVAQDRIGPGSKARELGLVHSLEQTNFGALERLVQTK